MRGSRSAVTMQCVPGQPEIQNPISTNMQTQEITTKSLVSFSHPLLTQSGLPPASNAQHQTDNSSLP